MDLSVLLVPLIGGLAVFGIAVATSDTVVVFEPISIPPSMAEYGYSDDIVTRQVLDEFAEIAFGAQSVITDVDATRSFRSESLERFTEFFEVGQLVTATRLYFGLIPYYFSGEIIDRDGRLEVRIRASSDDGRRETLIVSVPEGEIDLLIDETARSTMRFISPYLLMLYTRRQELAEGNLEFPRTLEEIAYSLEHLPDEELDLIHNSWGQLLRLQGNFDAAEQQFLLAIDIDPDFAFPYINMGSALAEDGQFEQAVAWWQRAIEIDPEEPLVHTRWADALSAQGDVPGAIAQMQLAIEKDPMNPLPYYTTGLYYEQVGATADAYNHFRRANELDRGNVTYQDAFLRVAPEPALP